MDKAQNVCAEKGPGSFLEGWGDSSREGKGLVYGHTAHWGQVCAATLEALASRELHLVFRSCKLFSYTFIFIAALFVRGKK